jgi:hypothetical protein
MAQPVLVYPASRPAQILEAAPSSQRGGAHLAGDPYPNPAKSSAEQVIIRWKE